MMVIENEIAIWSLMDLREGEVFILDNDQFAMRFLDVFIRSALRKTKGIKCL